MIRLINIIIFLLIPILFGIKLVYADDTQPDMPLKINLPVDYSQDPLKNSNDDDVIDDIAVKMLLKDDKLDKICVDEDNQFFVGLDEQSKPNTASNKAMNNEINEVQKFKKNLSESNKSNKNLNINALNPTLGFRLQINPDKNTQKSNSN